MVNSNYIVLAGIAVIFIGIILIFVGTILQSSSSQKSEGIQTAGVVMIGPIPIIFGNDKGLVTVGVIFTVILMVLSYILFYRGGS
jgi:uncharacterized protein (TIGR00304 family)